MSENSGVGLDKRKKTNVSPQKEIDIYIQTDGLTGKKNNVSPQKEIDIKISICFDLLISSYSTTEQFWTREMCRTGCQNLSNLTYQGTREMCRTGCQNLSNLTYQGTREMSDILYDTFPSSLDMSD
jgi:hypothetical protein